MELEEIQKRALAIKNLYVEKNINDSNKQWGVAEYTQGFVGDVGDLSKLVMVREGYRNGNEVEKRLEHELADCLWSVLVIADELGVDIETSFMDTMDELENKLKHD